MLPCAVSLRLEQMQCVVLARVVRRQGLGTQLLISMTNNAKLGCV